ncbi:MAG: RluA family pseudouridine synthase [Candidatus Uhrbacteria bacterium]|nr:RluA family pseudouridine synthase [Candidatus Uhrbacteria bacterium]
MYHAIDMMKHQTWKVKTEQTGERLDHFLVERLPGLSRSSIQKMIKEGSIMVNEKKAMVHRFLKKGDLVAETSPSPSFVRRGITSDLPAYSPTHLPALRVVDETPDWLVIDKPVGLLVHPDAKHPHGTLVDLLLAHDQKIARVGENPDRPGIVHRLDREVSGLMVVAKTQAAYESLQRQFAERKTEKKYLALVHGILPLEEGDIKFRIARSTSKARMAARPENKQGQAAWTHYTVKRRFVGASLLELEIFSGRTHQIRAHLYALRHPVIGDSLYALRHPDLNLKTPRLMLQSVGLNFNDPKTGTRKTYHLKPDPAFDHLINSLSSSGVAKRRPGDPSDGFLLSQE